MPLPLGQNSEPFFAIVTIYLIRSAPGMQLTLGFSQVRLNSSRTRTFEAKFPTKFAPKPQSLKQQIPSKFAPKPTCLRPKNPTKFAPKPQSLRQKSLPNYEAKIPTNFAPKLQPNSFQKSPLKFAPKPSMLKQKSQPNSLQKSPPKFAPKLHQNSLQKSVSNKPKIGKSGRGDFGRPNL